MYCSSTRRTKTCAALLVVICTMFAEAEEYEFTYVSPNGAVEQEGLITYHGQRLSKQKTESAEHPLEVDFFLKTLTVRSSLNLRAVDILDIAYDVAQFYGIDRLNELGITYLKILWGRNWESGDRLSYREGVIVERSLLDLIASNPQRIDVVDRFAGNIRRIVPSDPYDPQDDNLEGANAALGTIHTLTEGDEDWFHHSIVEKGYYFVETIPVDDRPRVDTIIDVMTSEYSVSNDDGGDEFLYSRALIEALGDTTISVRVRGFVGGSSGYYVLRVRRAPDAVAPVDPFEPNDSRDAAKAVDAGSETFAAIDSNEDVDWYRIEGLKTRTIYEVMIFSENFYVEGEMYARDSSEALELGRSRGEFYLTSKEDIFMRIHGEAVGSYSFSVMEYQVPEL